MAVSRQFQLNFCLYSKENIFSSCCTSQVQVQIKIPVLYVTHPPIWLKVSTRAFHINLSITDYIDFCLLIRIINLIHDLCNPEIQCCIHTRFLLTAILSRINPTSHTSLRHSNIVLPSTSRTS